MNLPPSVTGSLPASPDASARWFEQEVQSLDASLRAYLRRAFPSLRDVDEAEEMSALLAGRTLWVCVALASAVLLPAAAGSAAERAGLDPAGVEAAPEKAIELSPFTVSADSDVGYVATSSLAGSRLRTALRDTAASISVMTSEFLADIGANDFTDALQWANNVQREVTDSGGNDNGMLGSFARFRVRGIEASITRNYFTWRLATDSYNIDRIEEQRGPNSILFGIGGGGGLLNAMTKQANLGRTFRSAAAQAGSFGSLRGSLDVNQRALDGRVALRINAVQGHQGSNLRNVFNDTRRIHVASTFRATKSTTLRGEYEVGDLEQGSARGSNGWDGVTSWMNAGRPTIATAIPTGGANNATLAALGLANYGTATRVTYVGNTGQLQDVRNRNVSAGSNSIIRNAALIDHRVNTGGPGQKRYGDFSNVAFFVEQRLGERTFLELAYNHQADWFRAYTAGQGTSENNTLRADPHLFLPNGQPNPFAGRLMFEGRWNRGNNQRRADDTRLTVSHERDFGKWGSYRVAGLAEYEWRASKSGNQVEVWADRALALANQGPENASNMVFRRNYVVEGDGATYYVNGPAEKGLIQGLVEPVSGRTLSSTWVNFTANVADNPEYQKTAQATGQARYFNNRLILGAGLRKDWLDLTKRATRRAVTASGVPGEYGQFYDLATFEHYVSLTRTTGVVAHLPWGVSVFANTSNSFGLPNTNLRVLPNSSIPPKPESDGRDIGVALAALDGRLNVRVNHFVTKLKKGEFQGFGSSNDNPTTLARAVLTAMVANRVLTQAQMDARLPDTTGSIGDRQVEGYEATVSANLTKDWRLQANYSFTRGFDSNSAPEVKAWAAENIPFYLQHANLPTGDGLTIGQRVADWQRFADAKWSLEGLTLLGNRRHKLSFFTRYNLPFRFLKGAYVGGGYRHFGKSELGLSAANQIRYGNSYWLADLMAGYRVRQVPLLQRALTLQLNVANVADWQKPITTQFATDGSILRWTLLEPRTWRLTATVDF